MIFDRYWHCYELSRVEYRTIDGMVNSSDTKESAIDKIKLLVVQKLIRKVADDVVEELATKLYNDYQSHILKSKIWD